MVSPALVTGIAYLMSEAVAAGTSMAELYKAVRATGVIPDEEFTKMELDLSSAIGEWDAAPGPSGS